MKRFQGIAVLVLTLFVLETVFAGCGMQKKSADTPQAEASKASAVPEGKREKVKFVFWDMTTSPKEFATLVDAFNRKSSTVEVEPIGLTGSEYIEKTSIMLAAGEDIDGLVIKDLTMYSGCILKNQLASLDYRITKVNLNVTPYESNIDVLKKDGKIMALPYRSDFFILYYNKDIFDKAKVPYPMDDTTWDQFREIAGKLTSGEGNDKVWGTYIHTWENSVADICTATGKGNLISGNFEYLKPAYELVLGMEQEDKSAMTYVAARTSNAHYQSMFESGRVGMHVMGTWHIGQLLADKNAGKTKINWGIAKAPHFAGYKPGTTVGCLTPIAITASSGKADSAFEFLRFMAGEEGASILGSLGLMPGYKSQAIFNTIANLDGFPKKNKSALESAEVVQQLLPHKNAAQMKKILGEVNEMILTGEKTIEEGLKELNIRTKALAADNM